MLKFKQSMKESYLYRKLKNKGVQCRTCAHYCVIENGERGKCGVRENKDGTLFSLNYAKPCSVYIDPIEKKPLFHFLPGTETLSFATVGCNFSCKNCQNYEISQGPRLHNGGIAGEEISPKEITEQTLNKSLSSISYTYTEPTIFLEYALDTMKLAKAHGIKNIWVTNGFMSEETLKLITPYLDAANVDLKSFSDKFYQENCGGRLQPVLDSLKRIKKANVWLEVTTLVIPELSDDLRMLEQIAEWIKNDLGSETPWHITRFSGLISWKLQHLPDTPVQTLEKAYEIGKKAGLKYVYVGNVAGSNMENTYCPECNTLLIERNGYYVKRYDKNGKCRECNRKIDIIL